MSIYIYWSKSSVFMNKDSNSLIYFYITIALSSFWLINLFLVEPLRQILYLTFFSCALGVYLAEIYLYHSAPSNPDKLATEFLLSESKIPKDFDKRTKLEIIEDYKNSGQKISLPVFPKYMFEDNFLEKYNSSFFPLGGLSNKETVMCNESGEYVFYKSDRYGFNNPDENWDSKRVGWFLTGDSFTQGSCVNREDNIAGNIETITGEPVINMGMGGNGPLAQLATIIEYGQKIKPKRVIWIYFEANALVNLNEELTNPFLIKYKERNFFQDLSNRQNEIDKKIEDYISDKKKEPSGEGKKTKSGYLKPILTLQTLRFSLSSFKRNRVDLDSFKEILLKAQSITESWGGKFYVVHLPYFPRFLDYVEDHGAYYKKREVLGLLSDLKIEYVDLYEGFFKKQNDPISYLPLRRPGHFTPQGYKEISKTVISKIMDQN